MGTLCLNINTRTLAGPTNYTNFQLNSSCVWNGIIIGTMNDGIYEIGEQYNDDNGDNINAFFRFLESTLGIDNEKRLRSFNIRYQADGQLKIKYTFQRNEHLEEETIPATLGLEPQTEKMQGTRAAKGSFLSFEVSNILGSDFTLHSISTVPIVQNIGHSRRKKDVT